MATRSSRPCHRPPCGVRVGYSPVRGIQPRARMELRVALEEWFTPIPSFHLEEARPVLSAGGQVRGPRELPVVLR